MKKLFLLLITVITLSVYSQAEPVQTPDPAPSSSPRGITFRQTQKLRNSRGFEMFLYTDHSLELYDSSGVRHLSGSWKLQGNELFLYGSNGDFICKCNCRISGGQLSWIEFSGERYYRR